MKYLSISIVALLLASCLSSEAQNILPTPNSLPSTVISESQMPVSGTASPVPTVPNYSFPDWMLNPDTMVLAALVKHDIAGSRKVLFLNAATGERFELEEMRDLDSFFWYDAMHFGVTDKDFNAALVFALDTGRVSTQPVPLQPPDLYWNTRFSMNQQFGAQWDERDQVITVIDTKTQNSVWELALPKDRYGTEIIWSPIHENQLAFLHGSEAHNGRITENMTLSIVDVIEGEIISTFDGDFGVLAWSPNGKMILYLSPAFRYRNYGIPFQDAPCLLILATGEKKCLRSIPRLVPQDYKLSTTSTYRWAEDSNSIFFAYHYTSSLHKSFGNLCNYSLVDSHITCPTQNLDVMAGRSIVFYDLSPDQEFIHFCYSDSHPLSDAAGTSNDGIIRMDGSGFISWVGTILDGAPFEACSADTAWRPLP